jgi:hypothetical protein
MKKLQTAMRQLLADKQSRLSIMFTVGLIVVSMVVIKSVKGAVDVSDAFMEPVAQNTSPEPVAQATSPQNAPAQSSISGEWTAEFDHLKPGQVQMTFQRRSGEGGFNMSSDSVSLSELQGLTADAASSAKAVVNFSVVREAGTFACEGYFRDGKGAGFWTFKANPTFVSAMRGRGYTSLTDEDLLRAAFHNLTTKFIEDLKSVGYDRLSFEELVRGAGHDVTASYIREMRSAGYDNLSMEELIRARNHEIDGQYVREVQAMGFDKEPLEAVIRLRNHEITPEFINDLKAEGYSGVSAEMAIRLKNHDVDRAFIQRVKAQGMTNVTLDELIRLRNHGTVK